ncbi:tripartite tricarboxylate transporter substrate binding protein [Caenimonas sp. SL110]|uniref:Bug family tripartite tricarboxylate transporter substrate binding protein n=1 Tax=Caenimonas sp. SL110 TaxID=1450524 RepID=UPI0009E5E914|nr:tripartite tricarboxylate transporter substrate binding protein [Caenimonas sp. SL110]
MKPVSSLLRALGVIGLLWAVVPASAQGTAPIRLVVPTTAGGPLDVVARTLASAVARDLKETVIVENRPGAAGIIGTEAVVKAPPDGRTLLLGSGFVVTNTVLYKVNYDPIRDLQPVIQLTQAGMVMLARKGLDIKRPADLSAAAAAQRGGLNCGAPPGEMALGCEQLKQALGGAVVTVPYPGVAPAINALAAGTVDVMLAPYDAALPFVEGGRASAFASTGTRAALPPFDGLPLVSETWPGFSVVGLLAIFAPAGTPADLVRRLNQAFADALKDPQVRAFMVARGSALEANNPPERLAQTVADRLGYYRRLAATLGLKPE